ncbi:MAG: bifunctional DNA-formamidopyrimidine glycosylase/DNA-(apurinic or apyrimidinic site) lyase [Chloroflexi bacterium]|nr:bifunctional DNA-formamidopyrimidine glycosylase/DNA-(apurinic or apyrimidinic site) lyase [Chloroflexota bacterium]
MPELPEVETVVRGLRAPLIGRTITGVWTDWPKVIRPYPPEEFAARVVGQTFRAINRRAKYILCQLDHDILAIHLKMTGRLYVSEAPEAADRWVHFRLALDNGQYLHFSDARRFGRVFLGMRLEEFAPNLGPEPLEDSFTVEVLRERLGKRQRNIKALLLDQSFIAGVGNIYADEALFRAGIHPLRRASNLTEAEIQRLYETIRAALAAGIDYEGASINWYRKPDGTAGKSQEHFFVYHREGQPCARCGQLIVKIRVSQRGTHYCPNCQPEA